MEKPYNNRKTLLLFLGILEIFLGIINLGFAALCTAPYFLGAMKNMSFWQLLPSMLIYVVAAVFFLTTGIATLRLKHWVQPIMVVITGWGTFIGLLGTVQCMMIDYQSILKSSPSISADSLSHIETYLPIFKIILVVFCLVFFTIIPSLILWAYSNHNVKATFLNAPNNKVYWTDRFSTPALGFCFLLLLSLGHVLSQLVYQQTVFLNAILTEIHAVVFSATGSVCLLLSLFLCLKKHKAAWAVSLFSMILFNSIPALSLLWIDMEVFYQILFTRFPYVGGMDAESMAQFWHASNFSYMLLAWTTIFVGYTIWVRKYFVKTLP